MLSRVLLQQGELIRQISMRGDEAPASSNNDAITRLFEQQTQLLRSIADGSHASNPQESRVKLPVVNYLYSTVEGRGMEALFRDLPVISTFEREYR